MINLESHYDYLTEKKRLEFIINYVKDEIVKTEKQYDTFRRDTKEAFIEYKTEDSSLSYDEIALKAQFFYSAQQKYKNLLKAEKKPYFCRIDFKAENAKLEKLYIGKMALIDENCELLIVDWRAPVASVYYDSRLGSVSYDSPSGIINGELSLKRQYVIENGELLDITDIDITTNDEFLQKALGESKDNRLKDIVSTIQSEQNAIIRADMFKPLIVQGVAGSGKTTIALHRIAYLIYTYEKSFNPNNFLIIAPNKLFLNYISEVLPELGVERVRQMTFPEIVYKLTGIKYKLNSADDKINLLIESENTEENKKMYDISKFKGSLIFKEIIDRYIRDIENTFVPDCDCMLDDYLISFKSDIHDIFINDYKNTPIYKRIAIIKMLLRSKLKNNLPSLLEFIEADYNRKINEAKTSGKSKNEVVSLMDERDNKLLELKSKSKSVVNKYIAKYPKQTLVKYYENLVTDFDTISKYAPELPPSFINQFCEYNIEILHKKKVDIEDMTPLLYMQHRFFGPCEDLEIRNIVIDEAQDYSVFQVLTLKTVFKTEMLTILGDLAQGIHSYRGVDDWDEIKNIFNAKCGYLTLEQSYRTTVEIMDEANRIIKLSSIKGLIPAKPVIRHGEKPEYRKFPDSQAFVKAIKDQINSHLSSGYKTTAVICKTEKECISLGKEVTGAVILTSKEDVYGGNIIIVPSYLAKGLEFDAVIIAVSETDYRLNELDIKLLYVAMTRALHQLDIYMLGYKLSDFSLY